MSKTAFGTYQSTNLWEFQVQMNKMIKMHYKQVVLYFPMVTVIIIIRHEK